MTINRIINEPDWNQHLKTKESLQNYLSLRISELTDELKDQPTSLEKTGVRQRMKWNAQIIYYSFSKVIFSIGKLFGKMVRSEKTCNYFRAHHFNHFVKLGARHYHLKCHKELLVKSRNGTNLKRTNLPFRTDLQYDGKPINYSKIEGACYGMCVMFNYLYLEAKKKSPNLNDRDIILKIAHLMRDGALPEATIFQKLPMGHSREFAASVYPDVAKKYAMPPEQRPLERIEVLKSESLKKNQSALNKLDQLKTGVPHYIFNRMHRIIGGRHATLIIRTGSKEFYWFDPNRGLTFFEGEAGMKKLLKLWEFGPQGENEIGWLIEHQKALEECADDFAKRHQLTDLETQLIKKIDQEINNGKSWDEIDILTVTLDLKEKYLVKHYFQTRREKKRRLDDIQYSCPSQKLVTIAPVFDELIGKNIHSSQLVTCCNWKKPGRDWEKLGPFACGIIGGD